LNAAALITGAPGNYCTGEAFTSTTSGYTDIYQFNGLGVKRKRRHKSLATERLPLFRPDAPNLTWSMDLVMNALASGRGLGA
jgi:hypothetical protein